MPEQWKNVPGYEGLYQVSNRGRVRSLDRVVSQNNRWGMMQRTFKGKVLQPIEEHGYHLVTLVKPGSKKKKRVHRLVMLAFVGRCPRGKQVNHKNGEKTDNRLANLEYCTGLENARHSILIGLKPKRTYTKLEEDDVREIRKLLRTKNRTLQDIADIYGVHKSTIYQISKGKTWMGVK